MLKTIFLLVFCCVIVFCEGQDYDCEDNGVRGRCKDIRNCASAMKDLKLHIKPKICSFNATSIIPNVCCLDTIINIDRSPLLMKSNIRECKPISQDSQPKNKVIQLGVKAWNKCLEYQDQLVFPCTEFGYRESYCLTSRHYDGVMVGVGGINARPGEYPHMALLGYGNSTEDAEWLCGGSLISEKYILTAGHCLSTKEFGPVTFAALKTLRRYALNRDNIYKIKKIIRHPEYKPPSKYHDIALLETEGNVRFGPLVVPACLHVGDEVPDSRASATGWGALGHREDLANIMQDVPLWKVSNENCSQHYPIHRLMRQGYNSTTQMCYGDDGRLRDTCGGDSGGPLQIDHQDIPCTYLIIGVTSFGHANCAQLGIPGIYTRVAHYVPWIESVVWP